MRENLTSSSYGEGLETGRAATQVPHQSLTRRLKYDGFRALAVIERGHAQLISRNGHPFASFAALADAIAADLNVEGKTVLDGEIVCVDKQWKPQFRDLLFHRGTPCFFAFDLLISDGKDWRTERLIDRKQELRRLLTRVPLDSRLTTLTARARALFQRVCELDLEGIVAKHNRPLRRRP